jgi:hypothetical protein
MPSSAQGNRAPGEPSSHNPGTGY